MPGLSSLLKGKRACRWVLASCLVVQSPCVLLTSAWAQATDAKAQIAEGDKAARAKDWSKARDAYAAAYKAAPSAAALEGLANAEFQAKHETEAYAAYE